MSVMAKPEQRGSLGPQGLLSHEKKMPKEVHEVSRI
jgi:hypothetical protein